MACLKCNSDEDEKHATDGDNAMHQMMQASMGTGQPGSAPPMEQPDAAAQPGRGSSDHELRYLSSPRRPRLTAARLMMYSRVPLEAADELDGTHGHSDTPVGFSLG